MDVLPNTLLGIALRDWLVAFVTGALTLLGLRLVTVHVIGRLVRAASRTKNHLDDVLGAALEQTRWSVLTVVAVFVGASTLELGPGTRLVIERVTVLALLVQAGLWLSAGLQQWLEQRSQERAEEDPGAVMTMQIIGVAARITLWSVVLLLALDNLGVDVTALVAGLGVGGVAVALAAQNVLGDLFASLSIVLDKPFVLGDFVIVGDFLGSVEAIGLKTTRVRSLSGEQVVFSNADMLASRIRNYGRMFERRVAFDIGVTYQTPRDDLAAIPDIIREAIEDQGERVRFDRSHMASYGDFAIVFESVYYVLDADFNVHMDVKQEIYLRVHEVFEEREIEFAYPTQTLFLEASSPAQTGAAMGVPAGS